MSAAATAAQAGARVLVLEAHQPGGRARTVERDGFTFNMGAHALYTAGAGTKVLRSLGITPVGHPRPSAATGPRPPGPSTSCPTGPASLLRSGALSCPEQGPAGQAPGPAAPDQAGDAGPHVGGRVARLGAGSAPTPKRCSAPSSASAPTRPTWTGSAPMPPSPNCRPPRTAACSTCTAAGTSSSTALAGALDVRTGDGGHRARIGRDRVEVRTPGHGTRRRPGGGGGRRPGSVRRLLPADPGWGDLGPPLTAACLDLGVDRVPDPGYVLSLDEPLYATVQSPPARQAPEGQAVVAAIRYGARSADEDRPQLEHLVARRRGASRTRW